MRVAGAGFSLIRRTLDRGDARQSILGGARYLRVVGATIPKRIPEPDRTWLTLAAYNVGYGHLEDARILAQRRGLDPDRWADVRDTLPLLAQERYYTTLKRGYARGWEPVGFVRNETLPDQLRKNCGMASLAYAGYRSLFTTASALGEGAMCRLAAEFLSDYARITLILQDLLPDANGEIVIMGDGMHLSLVTDEPVCGSGIAEQHLTATGMDVGGLNYFAFADGTKLYVSPDVDLTIAAAQS